MPSRSDSWQNDAHVELWYRLLAGHSSGDSRVSEVATMLFTKTLKRCIVPLALVASSLVAPSLAGATTNPTVTTHSDTQAPVAVVATPEGIFTCGSSLGVENYLDQIHTLLGGEGCAALAYGGTDLWALDTTGNLWMIPNISNPVTLSAIQIQDITGGTYLSADSDVVAVLTPTDLFTVAPSTGAPVAEATSLPENPSTVAACGDEVGVANDLGGVGENNTSDFSIFSESGTLVKDNPLGGGVTALACDGSNFWMGADGGGQASPIGEWDDTGAPMGAFTGPDCAIASMVVTGGDLWVGCGDGTFDEYATQSHILVTNGTADANGNPLGAASAASANSTDIWFADYRSSELIELTPQTPPPPVLPKPVTLSCTIAPFASRSVTVTHALSRLATTCFVNMEKNFKVPTGYVVDDTKESVSFIGRAENKGWALARAIGIARVFFPHGAFPNSVHFSVGKLLTPATDVPANRQVIMKITQGFKVDPA